ncbi:hypothetical protein MCOR25_009144 [Pyricularia grisea]|uniref:Nudix hydrolase domain-containing protein n=1 Tax=Pyricularia grisea TaxID=148305 RepID=A0A6P8B0Q9_PYRGI|nr:uncharacterized protein PgNI_07956 [Pyricularia grisea]KAI6353171.1 hypothetical protein MCOR25_009144 [Pyricularia grisea]TLD08419.1 hypothetical protein PgNI_07956 [Pyricularia grisea]
MPNKQIVKANSVHGADNTRVRCGVVAFQPDGQVWMVASKSEGWILPKGGLDSEKDTSLEECVEREAMEEAGLELTWIDPLAIKEGTLHWYTAIVTSNGPRTDKELDKQKRALPQVVSVKEAFAQLSLGDQDKKASMKRALRAAVSYWDPAKNWDCEEFTTMPI